MILQEYEILQSKFKKYLGRKLAQVFLNKTFLLPSSKNGKKINWNRNNNNKKRHYN